MSWALSVYSNFVWLHTLVLSIAYLTAIIMKYTSFVVVFSTEKINLKRNLILKKLRTGHPDHMLETGATTLIVRIVAVTVATVMEASQGPPEEVAVKLR